jgi:hypothetical protein
MAKKSRRNRSAAVAKSTPAPKPAMSTPSSETKNASFTQDYVYVYEDIRTLGIIVAVMVVVTIGLSFVI